MKSLFEYGFRLLVVIGIVACFSAIVLSVQQNVLNIFEKGTIVVLFTMILERFLAILFYIMTHE